MSSVRDCCFERLALIILAKIGKLDFVAASLQQRYCAD